MCILLIEHPNLMDGWGCCQCHTYNGLHRDQCKACGADHCDLALPETDVLEARKEQ